LHRYLEHSISDYSRLVGRVNLASALVYSGNFETARADLDSVVGEARKTGYQLLLGNALEIRGHLNIERARWRESSCDLSAADRIFNENVLHHISVKKWRAVLAARKANDPEELIGFRAEAMKSEAWEPVREIDLQILVHRFDLALASQLFFGTPFTAFHERMRGRLLGFERPLGHRFGKSDAPYLELITGECTSGPSLKGMMLRILQVLLSDVYRPWSVGRLFSALYPSEHFSIMTSPGRVYQLLHRLRAWLDENGIPASILSAGENFRFHIKGNFAFLCARTPDLETPSSKTPHDFPQSMDPEDTRRWLKVFAAYSPETLFFPSEASRLLGLSPATYRRWANRARQRGLLDSLGCGPGVRHWLIRRSG
jgi:hypothetical protein